MLLALENIKKPFVEKYNKIAGANKAKVATASKAGTCPGNARMEDAPIKEPSRKANQPSIAVGAKRQAGPSLPMIPLSVVGLRRTAALRTGQLSPSIPQRSPGKRQAVKVPVR